MIQYEDEDELTIMLGDYEEPISRDFNIAAFVVLGKTFMSILELNDPVARLTHLIAWSKRQDEIVAGLGASGPIDAPENLARALPAALVAADLLDES